MCEQLRKRIVHIYCLQEVRWGGQGAFSVGVKGRRYKLGWTGKMMEQKRLEFL